MRTENYIPKWYKIKINKKVQKQYKLVICIVLLLIAIASIKVSKDLYEIEMLKNERAVMINRQSQFTKNNDVYNTYSLFINNINHIEGSNILIEGKKMKLDVVMKSNEEFFNLINKIEKIKNCHVTNSKLISSDKEKNKYCIFIEVSQN